MSLAFIIEAGEFGTWEDIIPFSINREKKKKKERMLFVWEFETNGETPFVIIKAMFIYRLHSIYYRSSWFLSHKLKVLSINHTFCCDELYVILFSFIKIRHLNENNIGYPTILDVLNNSDVVGVEDINYILLIFSSIFLQNCDHISKNYSYY